MAKYEPNSPQALAAAAKKAAKKFNTQLKQSPLYNAVQLEAPNPAVRLGAPNQASDTSMGPGKGVITEPVITQPAFGIGTSPGFSPSFKAGTDFPVNYPPGYTGPKVEGGTGQKEIPPGYTIPKVEGGTPKGQGGQVSKGGNPLFDYQTGRPLDPNNLPKEFFESVVGKYGSYASGSGSGSGGGLDRPGTGSTMVEQGLSSLTELGNKYADNEMIGGLVTGTFADIARTQANTGLAAMYQDAMFESMGRYQGNLENLRVGNTSKLMAQEAALTGGLMGKQGEIQTQGLRVAGDEQRKGIRVTGEEQRKGIRVTGEEDRKGIRVTGEEQRKGIRVSGEEQRKGIRVTGDENRKGIRETGAQERMNIDRRGVQNRLTLGEQGSQERMNIRERTQAQKNLRADARGAIRRSGARFFG